MTSLGAGRIVHGSGRKIRFPFRASGRSHDDRDAKKESYELGTESLLLPETRDEANPALLEEDPFSVLDRDPTEASLLGQKCEFHTYDEHLDSRGDIIELRTGHKTNIPKAPKRSPEAALILTRHFWMRNPPTPTTLLIQSPHIKQALREVIGQYPGINLEPGADLVLYNEPRCLFHYREELAAYAKSSNDPIATSHIDLCLRYMERSLREDIQAYNRTAKQDLQSPGIEFTRLWMLFKPGELLYQPVDGVDQVYRLLSMQIEPVVSPGTAQVPASAIEPSQRSWALRTDYVAAHDGKYTCVLHSFSIDAYEGYKAVRDLQLYPLRFNPDQEAIREKLVSRGRHYVALEGHHHRAYSGPAHMLSSLVKPKADLQLKQVSSRIMIDEAEFSELCPYPNDVILGSPFDFTALQGDELTERLTLCRPSIGGYCFATTVWGEFYIDHMSEIQFNLTAFDKLVFDSTVKSTILSVVKAHAFSQVDVDDFIEGKGKGIIFLLHGPPGVGKTFTAESIADLTKIPLLVVSMDHIAVSQAPEEKLDLMLRLAAKWKALLLMDEADVFLQKRDSKSYSRDRLVAVLLRALEYYQGLLLLTTNRAHAIDPAFQSRIHVSIAYPELTESSRKEIWHRLLERNHKKSWLDDALLTTLSGYKMDGRQIKNAIRIAHALAADQQRELLAADIMATLQHLTSFASNTGETACTKAKQNRNEK